MNESGTLWSNSNHLYPGPLAFWASKLTTPDETKVTFPIWKPRMKRCIGQGMGKGLGAFILSSRALFPPNHHMFTNVEAL